MHGQLAVKVRHRQTIPHKLCGDFAARRQGDGFGRCAEGVYNDKRLRFTAPHDCLPAPGCAVADDAGTKPLADAVVYDGGRLAVKCRAFVHNSPLRCREGVRLAGKAEPPQKSAADLVVQLLQRLPRLDHRPDLALARQDHAVHIGRNNRDFVALVRIGKAGHTGKLQEAVAEPMPARCTKLQH